MQNVNRNFRYFLGDSGMRNFLNESSLVTSVWNPGNVVVSESWC